jgi:hypothetical protein
MDFDPEKARAPHGLDEAELILTRAELEDLRDKLFVLQCAVQDVQKDLASSKTLTAYKDAVGWLIDSASPLLGTWPKRP